MSDTPRSDATPHNVAELAMLCRKLERELNEANALNEELEESLTLAYMVGAHAANSLIKEIYDFKHHDCGCEVDDELVKLYKKIEQYIKNQQEQFVTI